MLVDYVANVAKAPDSRTREFHETLPKKRMGAGALLFDSHGDLLIVEPSYKSGWEVPGGIVETDESPASACRREIREELGLDITLTELLCVDYNTSSPDYSESLMFLFAATTLTEDQIASIKLDGSELRSFAFVQPQAAGERLGGRLGRRVDAALRSPCPGLYLDDQLSLGPADR